MKGYQNKKIFRLFSFLFPKHSSDDYKPSDELKNYFYLDIIQIFTTAQRCTLRRAYLCEFALQT